LGIAEIWVATLRHRGRSRNRAAPSPNKEPARAGTSRAVPQTMALRSAAPRPSPIALRAGNASAHLDLGPASRQLLPPAAAGAPHRALAPAAQPTAAADTGRVLPTPVLPAATAEAAPRRTIAPAARPTVAVAALAVAEAVYLPTRAAVVAALAVVEAVVPRTRMAAAVADVTANYL
jgi:hypothetical protein